LPIHHDMLGALPEDTERIFPAIANSLLGASSCSAHWNVIVAGAVIPLHRHAVEEILVCLGGFGECTFEGGEPEPYRAGSVVIVPAHVRHTIRNVGSEPLRQLSFFAGDPPHTEWLESPGSVA